MPREWWVNKALVVRFWSYVNKNGPKPKKYVLKLYPELRGTRCWLWTGPKDKNSYGKFIVLGKHLRANRCAYEISFGKLKSKKWKVCHKCDIEGCINPLHLFKGTIQDNTDDMFSKGREHRNTGLSYNLGHVWSVGDKNGNTKLSKQDVVRIRKLHATGKYLQKELGIKFGVTSRMISLIVTRKNWTHV